MALDERTGVSESVGEDVTPERIQQLGSAFRSSRALLSAVELGVFTELAKGPLDANDLADRIGVHRRAARDFFDALVALELLERSAGRYSNTADTETYLDQNKPTYVGGMAEMQAVSGYRVWASLTQALRTGQPQTDAKGDTRALFDEPDRARRYLRAMTGGSMAAATAIARRFPWRAYRTLIDVGTAEGCLPVRVALEHEHVWGGGLDMPECRAIFEDYVVSFGLSDRLSFFPGNFLTDPLPGADVVVIGNVLCDLDLDHKRMLLGKAYAAVPEHGAVIVYESVIDDQRRHNASALLTSLAMVLQREGAFGFTGSQCQGWMADAGFARTEVEHLEGPRSMVVGYKTTPP